jgi:hypothetical protein
MGQDVESGGGRTSSTMPNAERRQEIDETCELSGFALSTPSHLPCFIPIRSIEVLRCGWPAQEEPAPRQTDCIKTPSPPVSRLPTPNPNP